MSQTLAIQTKTDNNHSTKKRHSLKTTTNTMPITRTRTSNHAKPYNLTIKSDIGPHLQFIKTFCASSECEHNFPSLQRNTTDTSFKFHSLVVFISRKEQFMLRCQIRQSTIYVKTEQCQWEFINTKSRNPNWATYVGPLQNGSFLVV